MPSHSRFLSTSGVRSFFSALYASCRCAGTADFFTLLGLVRELCRKVPPVRPLLLTVSSDSTWKLSLLSYSLSRTMSTSPAHPRRRPITWYLSRSALMVTARIAGFKPGTSPPPVRIPITPFVVLRFAIGFVHSERITRVAVHSPAILPDRSSEETTYAEEMLDPECLAMPTAWGSAAVEAGEKSVATKIRFKRIRLTERRNC